HLAASPSSARFGLTKGRHGSAARIARPRRFRDVGDHLLLRGWTEDFSRRYDRRLVAAVDAGQVLLERDAALARIDQRLRAAIAGGGSLLLLEAPAGIGKTRLVLAAGR